MLVLSRKQKQQIKIGDDVVLTVLQVKGNTVRIGIEAPRSIHVVRGELDSNEGKQPSFSLDLKPGEQIVSQTSDGKGSGEKNFNDTSFRETCLESNRFDSTDSKPENSNSRQPLSAHSRSIREASKARERETERKIKQNRILQLRLDRESKDDVVAQIFNATHQ